MPIYEYVCARCNESFSVLRLGHSTEPSCPGCGSSEVEKKVSVVSACGGRGLSATHFGGG